MIRQRRRPLVAGALAAAVFLATACTPAAGHPGAVRRPSTTPASPAAVALATNAGRRELAFDYTRRVLAAAPTPAGSRRVATSPTAYLAHALYGSLDPNLVTSTAWWIAYVDRSDPLDYVRSHLPAGWRVTGTSSGSAPGLMIDVPTPGYVRDARVLVETAPGGSGEGIRFDAQASWIPVRPDWDHVSGATAVEVVVHRGDGSRPPGGPFGGAPTVHRTLRGPIVGRLVDLINALVPSPSGVRHCPASFPNFDDTLRFATAAGPVTAVVTLSGCSEAVVQYPGGRTSGLDPGTLDAVVLRALGLAAGYGFTH